MNFFTRLIQLAMVITPMLVLGWLATQWFVPSGIFKVEHLVGEGSSFIDELKPSERVDDPINGVQRLVGDPVFFFLHPHREFTSVSVDVWFKNEQVPIIELGALSGVDPEVYTLEPLHNRLIDESDWFRLDSSQGQVLLQKEDVYGSISEFMSNPPPRERVATYRSALNLPYRIEDYQPVETTQSIDVSLRGSHELKTYIKDEALNFSFQYMDMNRDEGEDVLRLTVFNEEGLPVAEARAADDGNTQPDAQVSDLQTLSLRTDGLTEGVYKIILSTTRDIFFRSIQTSQQKIVFLNTIFLGDEVGFSESARGATLWTESKRLRAQTKHVEGLQTLMAGTVPVSIDEPYEWHLIELQGKGVESIQIPVGDIEVAVDGKAAFSQEQYFNPDPVTLSAHTTIEQLDVDYVLADYRSPRREGDWLVATVDFLSDQIHEIDDSWKLSFSTPGIQENEQWWDVHKIDVTFFRDLLGVNGL